MSGDRLAQIEAQAREHLNDDSVMVPIVELTASARDVLALVEIAKAARVFLEEHQRQKGAVLGEFDLLVYDEMETRLRSALARLDSEASE